MWSVDVFCLENNVTLVADIEEVFVKIGFQKDQIDVIRFIWVKYYEIG